VSYTPPPGSNEIEKRPVQSIWQVLQRDARAQLPPDAWRGLAADILRALLLAPGFQVLVIWRLSAWLRRQGGLFRAMSRITFQWMTILHACHIDSQARLGVGIALPHPVGIVIGEGVVVGDGAVIYQHVTLGLSDRACDAYPEVCEGAVLYAGAVVTGGVRIGRGARVGANAVVLQDVPDGYTAVGVPARVLDLRS